MWILIIYIYAGTFAKGDSVTLNNVPGFTSQQSCEAAAAASKHFVDASTKEFRYVCVKN